MSAMSVQCIGWLKKVPESIGISLLTLLNQVLFFNQSLHDLFSISSFRKSLRQERVRKSRASSIPGSKSRNGLYSCSRREFRVEMNPVEPRLSPTLDARYIVAANKKIPAIWNDNGKSRISFFYFLLIYCCQYRKRQYRIIRYME